MTQTETQPAADTYRAAIRRNYLLSAQIAAESDLDTRFALRDEQRENTRVCADLGLTLAPEDVTQINVQEFKRAHGRLSLAPKAKVQRRSQPWRMQA